MSNPSRSCRSPAGPPITKLAQKLLRRYKERILLENTPNDDHRMGPHDVDHRVSSKFREIVNANHRIVVPTPQFIYARFKLHQIVDRESTLSRPFHPADNSTKRKFSLALAAGKLLKDLEHLVDIEATVF